MKKTFVICRNMNEFMNWREHINFSIPNRECVAVLTDVPGYSDRLRGYEFNETSGHEVVRWGGYYVGPYWHEIEDVLAANTRPTVDQPPADL